jgi:protein phosphatase
MVWMKLTAWSRTDKGLRRETNQDSFLINEGFGLYVVADGMGGHSGGEVASALAVQTVEEFIKANAAKFQSTRELIVQAYQAACRRIYDKANNESPELSGMGTTMVLLLLKNNSIYTANVGDSRIYLYRKPYLWQMTEDHSLVYEQLRAGLIKDHQLKSFVGKNVITRSVGYERELSVDILERPLQEGDKFILCSDGLSGLVDDQAICQILNRTSGAQAVEECVSAALANGGDDNVTVVLVEVGTSS